MYIAILSLTHYKKIQEDLLPGDRSIVVTWRILFFNNKDYAGRIIYLKTNSNRGLHLYLSCVYFTFLLLLRYYARVGR